MNTPDWLYDAIMDGLSALAAVMKFAPNEQVIDEVSEIWVKVITPRRNWCYDEDFDCVQKAFMSIMQEMREFPTPADFLDYLPDREVRNLPYKKHQITASEQKEIDALYEEIRAVLRIPAEVTDESR